MIKGATTRDYERQAHQRIMADFLRAVEMITSTVAEKVKAEKGDIEYPPGTILPEGCAEKYKSASVPKIEKCCNCGNTFEAESWYEPPQCPWCHTSRTD